MKEKKSVDVLIKALNNEDPEVRGEAATALGALREPWVVIPLLQMLEIEEDVDARIDAI